MAGNLEDYTEDDLFGPDNEDYMQVQACSSLLPPTLPPAMWPSGNSAFRGNSGSSFWHSSRTEPFKQQGPRRGIDERLVAEMKLGNNQETLAHKCPPFQEPCEIACFSRTADGNVHYDDRSLRRFHSAVLENTGANLNIGFERFVEKREDLDSSGFGDVLDCLRANNICLDNIHFVTFRNNLNKILGTAYNRSEAWEMGVHKRRGTVYLDVHKLPEGPQTERHRRLCYWGYSFEHLATECSDSEADQGAVNANVEFCALIKTKLGAHRIIMGAEMDCCDTNRDGKRRYIELKTSYEPKSRSLEKFQREKLLKFWIQSFLAGVPIIVCAFRDEEGLITRTELMGTRDITQRVKERNLWQGGVCLAFADKVLCWLYGTVKDNEDYVLKYLPASNKLELRKSEFCPKPIIKHMEEQERVFPSRKQF